MKGMDRVEEARLAWQRAQAELQSSLAELERIVASDTNVEQVLKARALTGTRQKAADEFLNRYITQLGKSA
jgi:flagellar biosynthesis chaperone FliJ